MSFSGRGGEILRALAVLVLVGALFLGRGAATYDWRRPEDLMKPLMEGFSRAQFAVYNNASYTYGASSNSSFSASASSLQGVANQVFSDIVRGGSDAIEVASSHIQRPPLSMHGMGSTPASGGGAGGRGGDQRPEDVVDDIWELPSKIGTFREGLATRIPLSETTSPAKVLHRLRRRAYAR